MPFGLLKQSQEVKNAILKELSVEGPLTAKDTYRRILARLNRKVTYQAVHKALKELIRDSILQTEGKKYFLNPTLVGQVKAFADLAERKAAKKSTLDFDEIQNATSQTLVFDSYMAALYALLENIAKEIAEKGTDITIVHWRHPWPITCVSTKEYEQIRQVMAIGKHYALVSQKTPLDLTLCSFWKKLGKKIIIGEQCANDCDLVVTQDKIVQVFLSPALNKALDKVFKNSSKGNALSELYEKVFKLEGRVKVVITKNGALANQIREETLKAFKKNRGRKP